MRTREEVTDAFTPIGGLTSTQQVRIMKMQAEFKNLAFEVLDLVPEGAHRTAAMRKILDAKFACIQEITHSKELRANEKSSQAIEQENQKAYEEREKAKAHAAAEKARIEQKTLEAKQEGKSKGART